MARKQVIVNEEMIRGIMAGDIPNYGKDIPKMRSLPLTNPGRVIAKLTIRNLRLSRKVALNKRNERTVQIRTASSSSWVGMSGKDSRLISVSTITSSYRSFYRL